MFTPKITLYDTKIIPKMYEEGWIMVTIHDEKIFWHKEIKKIVSRRGNQECPRFIEFYGIYPNKKSKEQAIKEWNLLSEEEKTEAIKACPIYAKWCVHKFTENGKLIKDKILHPSTYLHNKRWNDDIEIEGKSKDTIIREEETIKKRQQEEISKQKKEKLEEKEAEELLLIIRRLKENKPAVYDELYENEISKIPEGTFGRSVQGAYKVRGIISANKEYYKNLSLIS